MYLSNNKNFFEFTVYLGDPDLFRKKLNQIQRVIVIFIAIRVYFSLREAIFKNRTGPKIDLFKF